MSSLQSQARGARDPAPTEFVYRMYITAGSISSTTVWMVQGAVGGTRPLDVGLSGSESRLLSWLVMTMVNRIHHGVTSVKYRVAVNNY